MNEFSDATLKLMQFGLGSQQPKNLTAKEVNSQFLINRNNSQS
jgi:hypothetical protein